MIVSSLDVWAAQAPACHRCSARPVAFAAGCADRPFVAGKIDIIPGRLFCLLQEMDSVPFHTSRPESHRQFIDLQYLIAGEERMGVSRAGSGLHHIVENRTPQQDLLFWDVRNGETEVVLTPGMFAVFFPDDIHRPCCCLPDKGPTHLRKAVIKIDRALLEASQ
ncbi:DUF386 domain-containing protein (plasmid) [Salmonella enterica subsp. enterica serovar Karamoja]|uniref:DUF386 domain-containing protein n=1 Tax=Salmonella enterica subsp. enterica serovar Karamoja TaxID=2500153 RepID=A0A3Q9MPV9_SALET|nr:DUF386 domain-containing protein [Salmonella enterica subsp. enterica serovar Karamoja]